MSLWHDAWHEAHARIVPPELTRVRTLRDFTARLRDALQRTRVAGARGGSVGFCIVKGDELDHLFVAASARGSGAAAALLADAEARLAASGVEVAWLACAIGNERAARFYEKWGGAARACSCTARRRRTAGSRWKPGATTSACPPARSSHPRRPARAAPRVA